MTINTQEELDALKRLARNIVNQILDGAVSHGGYELQDMKKRQVFNDVADEFVTDAIMAFVTGKEES